MRFLENEKHGDNAVADQAFDIHGVNSCVGQSDKVVRLEDTRMNMLTSCQPLKALSILKPYNLQNRKHILIHPYQELVLYYIRNNLKSWAIKLCYILVFSRISIPFLFSKDYFQNILETLNISAVLSFPLVIFRNHCSVYKNRFC